MSYDVNRRRLEVMYLLFFYLLFSAFSLLLVWNILWMQFQNYYQLITVYCCFSDDMRE